MSQNIQANLKPETIERIEEISEKPVTRGLDKMINECFDKLQSQIPQEQKSNRVGKCPKMMELVENEE